LLILAEAIFKKKRLPEGIQILSARVELHVKFLGDHGRWTWKLRHDLATILPFGSNEQVKEALELQSVVFERSAFAEQVAMGVEGLS